MGRRDRLSVCLANGDAFAELRGDFGGTGNTADWMKLVRLVDVGVDGDATGDPERQDMQGASGKDRRGQRWSIVCE